VPPQYQPLVNAVIDNIMVSAIASTEEQKKKILQQIQEAREEQQEPPEQEQQTEQPINQNPQEAA